MRKIVAINILILLAVVIGCEKKVEPPPTEITFLTDFGKAKAEAIKASKPLVIDFYTDWCKWCHVLDTVTYKDSLVISMTKDMFFVKIDAEVDTELARAYGVSGYPTIVIAKSDGAEIDRIWGYLAPTDFYNQVHSYLQGHETLDDFLTRLQDEPENLDYLTTVAEKYANRSNFTRANEYYQKVIELDPDNGKGYGAKAMVSLYDNVQNRTRDYKGAIETCNEIIKRFPDTQEAEDASAMLGYFTAKSGDEKTALTLYRQYLEKYPNGRNNWVKDRIADLEEKLQI